MGKKILIGTFNKNKVEEIQALLGSDFHCINCEQAGLQDVEETGSTLEANAILKAKAYFEATQVPTLADDTGLEVFALNGAPGVISARYAGIPSDASKNKAKLLSEMKDIQDRSAQFRTVIAYHNGLETRLFEGIVKGQITWEEKGQNGFGYDSIFVPENETQTFAEMSAEKKNSISHRAQAIQLCVQYLQNEGK